MLFLFIFEVCVSLSLRDMLCLFLFVCTCRCNHICTRLYLQFCFSCYVTVVGCVCVFFTKSDFYVCDASVLYFLLYMFHVWLMNSCDSVFWNWFRFMLLCLIRIVKFIYLFLHICNHTWMHVVHLIVFTYMSPCGKLRCQTCYFVAIFREHYTMMNVSWKEQFPAKKKNRHVGSYDKSLTTLGRRAGVSRW